MKLSYRWLQKYVATQTPPENLAERFRLTSSEVESIESWSERVEGLVVGQIVSVSAHPNADRLRVTSVDVGKSNLQQIICGAPNVSKGQYVIVALPNTTLRPIHGEPMIIQQSTIRGSLSDGMLCSFEEIGLPIQSVGIISLEGKLIPGMGAAEALGLDDSVFDLEITPNRPDLLGVLGLAREVGSFEHRTLKPVTLLDTSEVPTRSIAVPEALCLSYVGALITCAVTDSPYWMQRDLLVSGIKPINLIVDVTNYVMMELGQPLHAFDAQAASITPSKPGRVRLAKAGETLRCLDGQTRTLTREDIVITDAANHPAALAGVMGGSATAISPTTTTVFIESAVFDGAHIRRSSARHNVRTEASTRMEKGLDREGTTATLNRALLLLQELGGATVIERFESPNETTGRPRIRVQFDQIQDILGIRLSPAECKRILLSLGFVVDRITKSHFCATPPSWRQDVTLAEDIIEELIRIWGYERVPATLPAGVILPPQSNQAFKRKSIIRRTLAAAGFHETVSLSFTSETALFRTSISSNEAIRLETSLSREVEFLIPEHLLPFMQNISGPNREVGQMKLFEIGTLFRNPLQEIVSLSLIIRDELPVETLLRQTKGVLALLIQNLTVANFEFIETAEVPAYYTQALRLQMSGKNIGWIGHISQTVLNQWKIRKGMNVIYVSFDLQPWLYAPDSVTRFKPLSNFPTIERDLTVTVSENTGAGVVLQNIQELQRSDLQAKAAVLLDIYRGNPLDTSKKSLSFRLWYGSDTRTLTDVEVSQDLHRITEALSQQ